MFVPCYIIKQITAKEWIILCCEIINRKLLMEGMETERRHSQREVGSDHIDLCNICYFPYEDAAIYVSHRNVTDKETKLKELPSLEFPEGRKSVIARSSGSGIIILLQTVARIDGFHP